VQQQVQLAAVNVVLRLEVSTRLLHLRDEHSLSIASELGVNSISFSPTGRK
jgi:hypothetical protein